MMLSTPSRYLFAPLLLVFSQVAAQSFTEGALTHGMQHVAVASDFMGAAVAIFDYDNDGWQDVYLTGGLEKDKLFRNIGNGVFTDVTATAGGFTATIGYKTTSVVTADLDNDGYREIIVGTARNMPLFVYKNNGNGSFTHITPTTGITTTKNTQAIVSGDYDLDGKLDIYVINYVLIPRTVFDSNGNVIGYNHTCTPNDFYRNQGALTFQEIGATLGVADAGCGLAGIFTDINGDFLPDLYVANDFGMFTNLRNCFFSNTYPPSGFQDQSASSQLNAAIFGMGIAQGDYDKDGKLDLYVTNLGPNILYRQTTPGVFQDMTLTAGVADGKDENDLNVVGWGTAFFDYDNDGYEDLYVSNGYVPAAKTYETSQDSENKLYHNLKNGTFEDVSAAAGVNDKKMHRGMAVGDFDNDGDEDLLVTKLVSTGVPVKDYTLYYINNQSLGHHWIQVSLQGNGTSTNRDGFGSTVKVYYANTKGVKALSGGSSHASQSSSVLHFGLNTTAVIDSIEVYWPGGQRQLILNPPVDKHIRVVQSTPGFAILGCTNASAANFDSQATVNYGCYFPVPGCTTTTASNYNPAANADDGSCEYVTAIGRESIEATLVYPNPFTDELTVSPGKGGRQAFEMFDAQGKRVFQAPLDKQTTYRPQLTSGIYYYRLTSQGHVLQTGKVVRQ
jgi:hypothetical protein